MAKREIMATTALSVLIFVFPGCQSNGNPNMPQLQTDPASKLDGTSATSQSKMVTGEETPTPRQLGCAQSQVWKTCGKAAEDCAYKFKVVEVDKVDQQKLSVSYPPSVWEQTRKEDRNTEEARYRNQYDKTYPIHIKRSESPITAGKIYLFTRCTGNGKNDNDFTLGEAQPDE